ncbi:CesT family type III secretion system chaperone, partial [Candidatus Similichlamydia epinepheli]|uniref:CesT family type III secretion system chaperone n=1 Tax=Candidatus Similichlamydia epinepheli TaxID=1903953 RepID=UPI000D37530E
DFDENNTCILAIDNDFSMHMTYETTSKKLYIYSPLLDSFPEDKDILMKLYETLLRGSILGGQMAGGGVGIAPEEQLILIHSTLEMSAAFPDALKEFAPLYVEIVDAWRKVCSSICAGQEVDLSTLPVLAGKNADQISGMASGASGSSESSAKKEESGSQHSKGAGDGFIRI